MCGRYSLTTSIEELHTHFQLQKGAYLKPRYNIAPGESIPVLKIPGEMDFLRWGFIASWMNSKPHSGFINARLETISQKPAFKEAFRKRRCIIVADGYYEWKQEGRIKQPYYIRHKDNPVFAFAGIWENETCAIVTTVAHAPILEIHPRMPVILDHGQYSSWLNPSTSIKELEILLSSFSKSSSDAGQLKVHPVSHRVNNPKFEGLECIRSLKQENA